MVDVPVDLTDDLVWTPVALHLLHIGFLLNQVEVLVQLIEEVVEELLTVLVIEASELVVD